MKALCLKESKPQADKIRAFIWFFGPSYLLDGSLQVSEARSARHDVLLCRPSFLYGGNLLLKCVGRLGVLKVIGASLLQELLFKG